MRPAGYQSQSSSSGQSGLHFVAGISAARRKVLEERLVAVRKAQELRAMLNSLEKVDNEGRRTSLLDSVCATEVRSN